MNLRKKGKLTVSICGCSHMSTRPRYFDCLSEDLIGDVLSFLGVRCLDNACHVCKAVSQVAMRLMPLWIGVAASAGEDSAAGVHCGKPLAGARQADPAGGAGSVPALSVGRHGRARPGDSAGGQCSIRNRVFAEIVKDRDVPSMIGCKDYRGLAARRRGSLAGPPCCDARGGRVV